VVANGKPREFLGLRHDKLIHESKENYEGGVIPKVYKKESRTAKKGSDEMRKEKPGTASHELTHSTESDGDRRG